ncbi:MAG: hypothetical protein MJ078_04935, partial [Clostridia bacterium]|nr:hypothetical protein [Clostridia bacterium]
PGEPAVPLAKCASGGETARVMLAIKCVIARRDGLPTVIFDEIDSGVSGKTSRKIGFCLQKAAAGAQIIAVTHSAQIASLASCHLLVQKQVINGRTASRISEIKGEERENEIARILGGVQVTVAQRQAAKDMLSGKA